MGLVVFGLKIIKSYRILNKEANGRIFLIGDEIPLIEICWRGFVIRALVYLIFSWHCNISKPTGGLEN